MIRAISWIIILAVLVSVAVWFADRPGVVTLNWQGWRIDTTVGFLMLGVALIAVLAATLYRIWLFLRRTPLRIATYRRATKREQGYRALTEGMVAVAAGDAAEAARQAKRADALLGEPPLTMLLSAQAAQLNGDDAGARIHFTNMLGRPETAFLGLRGLLVQAQKADDTEAALHYARRAYELRPKTPWVLPAMFDLQVKLGNWVDALSSLDEAVRRRSVSQEDGRGRRVVVLLGCSDEAAKADDMRGAISYARKAYNQSPEFLPATIRLVGLMVEDDKLRPASRIIHNAWTREPHPELARIYGAMAPSEEAVKKVRRYERLLSFNPNHPESHIAVAEASLEAKLWGSARSHLESAAETHKTAKICRLMAEVEEAEHNDSEAARRWLIEAATADPQPAWLCSACGAAWAEWTPVCGRCGELGGQEWRIPMNAAQPTAIPAPGGKSLAAPDAAQTETENPKLTPTTSGAN